MRTVRRRQARGCECLQWHGWWAPDRAGRTDEVVLGRGALAGEEICRLLEGGEATQRQVHVVAQDEDDVDRPQQEKRGSCRFYDRGPFFITATTTRRGFSDSK